MSVENQDIVRVTCKFLLLGEDVQNVFHIQNQGAGSVDDGSAHVLIMLRREDGYNELVPLLSENFIFETFETFNITQDKPMQETNWIELVDGDKIDQVLPKQTSALMLFPTGSARSQGRKYIGGFTEDSNAVGAVPSPALVTALTACLDAWLEPWIVGTGTFNFGNYRKEPLRFAEWLSGFAREVWRTQRRRATGVGS